MHGPHAYSGTFTHTALTYTNESGRGVRICCILAVLSQQGLCAAAAVGLTSPPGPQSHCWLYETRTEMAQAVQL